MHKYMTSSVLSMLIIGTSIVALATEDRDVRKKIRSNNKVKGELSVMVLGSGGPVAMSYGRASAGYLVFTDGKPRILMDLGGGSLKSLAQTDVNIKDTDIFLLSHLHADHTGDLTPTIKTLYASSTLAGTQRTAPIHIYGPDKNGIPFPGTTIAQYPSTTTYVHDHYAMPAGSERYLNHFFPTGTNQGASKFSYEVSDLNSKVAAAKVETVLSTHDGLVVKAIAVDHGSAPAVAFRIEYKGHSVVYSGDTGSNGPNMVTLSQNADMLIYDTSIMDDLPPIPILHIRHTSPTRLGEVAAVANVKLLILSHISQITEPRIDKVKQIIRAQGYRGKIKVAADLKVYNLGDDN